MIFAFMYRKKKIKNTVQLLLVRITDYVFFFTTISTINFIKFTNKPFIVRVATQSKC